MQVYANPSKPVWAEMEIKMELSISIAEAARHAGVGRSTIYQAVGRGELRVKKIGRRSIILTEDLAAWVKALPDASLTKSAA